MATDAEIRAAGFYAVPKNEYLQNEFKLPTTEEEKVTESFGIPNTNAFTNSGDDNYTRGYNFNNNGFQQAVDARQYNLNNPNKINQFVNKGLGFVGMEPQRSYQDMMQSGVTDERLTSGIPLGVGAMIARGLPDRYYDMSLADQAYTQANMGYTGPTIFGENNSGLSKDPFGRNVRSALGNYGEAQQKSIDKFDNLVAGYTKPGYDGKYAGLSLEEDEDGNYSFTGGTKAEIDYANKMHKVNLARYNYDKKGIDFRNRLKEQEIKDFNIKSAQDAKNARDLKTIQQRASQGDSMSDIGRDMYTGPGQAFEKQSGGSSGKKGTSTERNYGGRKDGGRIGYFFGGRVNYKAGGRINFRGGGMDMGNEENQKQSAEMANTTVSNNNNNDGGNKPPVTVVEDKTSIIDTSRLKSKNPEININYTDPKNYASLKSRVYNTNILDNDDVNVDGILSGEIGPVGYNTNFTDQGIVGTNLTAGNFNANISPDMEVQNIGYKNNIDGVNYGINTDFDNTMFTAGVNFKNGGLASIL